MNLSAGSLGGFLLLFFCCCFFCFLAETLTACAASGPWATAVGVLTFQKSKCIFFTSLLRVSSAAGAEGRVQMLQSGRRLHFPCSGPQPNTAVYAPQIHIDKYIYICAWMYLWLTADVKGKLRVVRGKIQPEVKGYLRTTRSSRSDGCSDVS